MNTKTKAKRLFVGKIKQKYVKSNKSRWEQMKRKQITLRLNEELWERLKKESKEKGMSMAGIISIILCNHYGI